MMFKLFKKNLKSTNDLDMMVEKKFLTKEEMLLLKRDRAIKEYDDFTKIITKTKKKKI